MFFYLILLMNFWKLTFSKLRFYWKENLKTCTTFEEQKGTKYIRGNVYFGIIVFSCLSSTKPCLRFLLICFDREIKGFYQSSLGNEFDFTDIMNVSPNILAKNQNFKKLRHGFVNKRTMSTMTLTSSCHWKNLVPFWLRKKNPSKNSELSQNRTEKQIMLFKTTLNWLFNDTWCYLVIGIFYWKIGIFQQTVVRGLFYP